MTVNCIKFVIPGEPQSKERPRTVRRASGVRTYTPAKTHRYEDIVRYFAVYARKEHKISEPINSQCGVSIKAYFGIPKSFSKKRRELCLKGKERPTKKPDSDNIAKIIFDGMNPKMKLNKALHKKMVLQDGFYEDDKLIVTHSVEKWYSMHPHVEVTVTWED